MRAVNPVKVFSREWFEKMNESYDKDFTTPFRRIDAQWLTPEAKELIRRYERDSQPQFFALLNMPGAE